MKQRTRPITLAAAAGLALTLTLTSAVGIGQDAKPVASTESEDSALEPKEFLRAFQGKWKGNCKTWFQPGKLADESDVEGKFELVLNGNFLRHTYTGSMMGKLRNGEDTLAYNPLEQLFQSSWFDEFHMNYGILFSEGEAMPGGFSVRGQYRMGTSKPYWGWRTEYDLIDNDHLTITAYNIMPDASEGKAVERVYERVE